MFEIPSFDHKKPLEIDDPELYQKVEIPHREFFLKIAKFHAVGKIQDKEILKIIHLNYRLSYLRDNALGFFLDERSMALITLVSNRNVSIE